MKQRPVLRYGIAVAAVLASAACAADAPTSSTVPTTETTSPKRFAASITVHAGPTCPVERPDQPCPDRPVEGVVTVRNVTDGSVVASGRTDADGTFVAELVPGGYRVSVDTGGPLPRCEPVDLTVLDRDVAADIACDTGIR